MAIRELSHERRNIMLPRYWRYIEQEVVAGGGSVSVGAGDTQILISSVITPREPSHLHVHGQVGFTAAGTSNIWVLVQFQIYESVGGGGWARHPDVLSAYCHLYRNTTHAARAVTVPFDLIFENKAADVTLQYKLTAQSPAGSVLATRPTLILDICRD